MQDEIHKKLQALINILAEFCKGLVQQSVVNAFFVADVFMKGFEITQAEFLHNCDNTGKLEFFPQKKRCRCSLLEILFRFNLLLKEEL